MCLFDSEWEIEGKLSAEMCDWFPMKLCAWELTTFKCICRENVLILKFS